MQDLVSTNLCCTFQEISHEFCIAADERTHLIFHGLGIVPALVIGLCLWYRHVGQESHREDSRRKAPKKEIMTMFGLACFSLTYRMNHLAVT